jgi:hypothetical protein
MHISSMAESSFLPYLHLGPIAPPQNVGLLALAAFQVLVAATSFSNERSKPTAYSKFASDVKLDRPIPSQLGMFGIYIPATITALTAMYFQSATFSSVTALLFLHFLKRDLEVAFLHKYSGSMPANNSIGIGIYYALMTALIILTAIDDDEATSPTLANAGMGLFLVGELGNLYHHYLLRRLRENNDTKGYLPPRGAGFEYVATPHYLFELVAWFGIACVAQQLNAFLVFFCMCSYLAGRAYKTNELYRHKFEEKDWPHERKNLVPFLF